MFTQFGLDRIKCAFHWQLWPRICVLHQEACIVAVVKEDHKYYRIVSYRSGVLPRFTQLGMKAQQTPIGVCHVKRTNNQRDFIREL